MDGMTDKDPIVVYTELLQSLMEMLKDESMKERYIELLNSLGPQDGVCEICDESYQGWVISSRDWKKIPDHLYDKWLCFDCYMYIVYHYRLYKLYKK